MRSNEACSRDIPSVVLLVELIYVSRARKSGLRIFALLDSVFPRRFPSCMAVLTIEYTPSTVHYEIINIVAYPRELHK